MWESARWWLLVGEELAGLVLVTRGGKGAVGGEEGVHLWVGVVEPPGAHAGAWVAAAGFPGSPEGFDALGGFVVVPPVGGPAAGAGAAGGDASAVGVPPVAAEPFVGGAVVGAERASSARDRGVWFR